MTVMAKSPEAGLRSTAPLWCLRPAVAAVVWVAAVGALLFRSSVPAAAQDPLACDLLVVDTSGTVDVDRVQQVILAEAPDEVRFVVRGFESVPDGDLEAAVNEVVAECFGDESSGLEPSTVVLSVSVTDRVSDLWVGDRWLADVGVVEDIRGDVMGSRFGEGDFTGGFVDGITEISDRIELAAAADAGDDPDEAGQAGETGSGNGSQDPSAGGADDGGDGTSPLTVLGGLAALGLGGGAVYAVGRRRKLVEARQSLDTAMAGPLSRVGMLRERDDKLTAQAEVWEKLTAGRTAHNLADLRRDSNGRRQATEVAAALMSQALPNGVEQAQLAEIDVGKQRLVELSQALDIQDEALDRLLAFGAHLDHLRVAVPSKQRLLLTEVETALRFADQRASEGWAVDSQVRNLTKVREAVEALDFSDLEQDWLTLSDRVEDAEAVMFAAQHYLQALPTRVESLKTWNAELTSAGELEVARAEDVRRRFVSLASLHAGDSWQWAADFPERAIEDVRRATVLQQSAIGEMLASQQFDQAGRELEQAGLHIITADHLLDQIEDLMVDLEKAREEAAGIVAQAREILAELGDFIGRHDDDLDDAYNVKPAQFARAVDGLDLELGQVKPNYLRVAETGYQLNRQMDELLAAAQDEQAQMQALRREAGPRDRPSPARRGPGPAGAGLGTLRVERRCRPRQPGGGARRSTGASGRADRDRSSGRRRRPSHPGADHRPPSPPRHLGGRRRRPRRLRGRPHQHRWNRRVGWLVRGRFVRVGWFVRRGLLRLRSLVRRRPLHRRFLRESEGSATTRDGSAFSRPIELCGRCFAWPSDGRGARSPGRRVGRSASSSRAPMPPTASGTSRSG